MDIYVALTEGADPNALPIHGVDLHGPDYTNGWILEGSESNVFAALRLLESMDVVRFHRLL